MKVYEYKDAVEAWRAGVDYDDLHVYYVAPVNGCECDACDRGRLWERIEEGLDDGPFMP